MLDIHKLSFAFNSYTVLENLSLSILQGEIATLIGASGAGKTTLFRLLTGSLPVQQGSFTINKADITASQQVAYMRQEELLLPWRNVLDNLLLLGELGKNKKNRSYLKEKAHFYLSEVGLQGWEQAYPDQLSGGMKQRVSLARALLEERPLLLLDEPFSALDVGLREQMHVLLKELRTKHNMTILMVTHDFRDALSLSDRIFLLDKGKIAREWQLPSNLDSDPLTFQQVHQELLSAIRTGMAKK